MRTPEETEFLITFCEKFLEISHQIAYSSAQFSGQNIFTIYSAFSRSLIWGQRVIEINLSPEMIHKTNEQGDDKCCVSVDLH